MSAAVGAAAVTAEATPDSEAHEPSSAATSMDERGSLSIHPSVVRKVAQRAADVVDGTTRVERKVVGVGVGSHGAIVKVTGDDNVISLSLDVALHYPAPVRQVVANVCDQVTKEVERITSYQVRRCAVTVSALLPDIQPRVR